MKTKIFALFIFSSFLLLNSCSKKNDAPVVPVAPVATATPTAQTIDSGTVIAIALSSSIQGTSFSWTVIQSGVSGASSGSGTSIQQTLYATGATAGTATYSITPSSNGTFGSVVSVSVTVNPPAGPVLPVAIVTPSSQTIETGKTTSIALSSSLTGTTFSWTVVQAGVTGASSGSGSNISQNLSITGTVAGTATYSVTPSLNGTSGSAVSVTITVNPAVVVVPKVTYTANIKPLLTTSCKPCHIAGGPNPKWDNYATAKSKISTILDRVQRDPSASGFMPQGGSKLTADNIALLKKWVADGLLEN